MSESVSMLTREQGRSGTLVYMSPQQLKGERGSHLDDIYSLGAMLYDPPQPKRGRTAFFLQRDTNFFEVPESSDALLSGSEVGQALGFPRLRLGRRLLRKRISPRIT